MRRYGWLALLVSGLGTPALAQKDAAPAPSWPQFRGANGRGFADDGHRYPQELDLNKNLLWKRAVPPGPSSPCIWGPHIFLTTHVRAEKKLETIALERKTGAVLWRRLVPAEKIERTHQISSPASATPATDGECVYVYFGSFGLLCYDLQGKELWRRPLPFPNTRFGTGASPIVAGGRVLLNCEFPPMAYLVAVDAKTGNVGWKKERLPISEGYATAIVLKNKDRDEILMHHSSRLVAYDPKDGGELWWVRIDSIAASTPVLGEGHVFLNCWYMNGDAEDRVDYPTFDVLAKQHDKDKDGRVSKAEFPKDLFLLRRAEAGDVPGAQMRAIDYFGFIDKSKDGFIDAKEWQELLDAAAKFAGAGKKVENGLLAIRPDGSGDVTNKIVWTEKRGVPEVPSPLYYRGRVWMVKDGGIVSCVDARTGKLLYRERLGALGSYFSSPVAADGKVYVGSRDGIVTVFAAGDSLKVLSRTDFEEPIMATPAPVEGKVYLRTDKHLYAFGQ